MDPLTIIAGASVASSLVTGLLGAYEQAKARKAGAAELANLKRLIDAVQAPNFDMSSLTPEDYKVVGKYNPQLIDFVEEKFPELVKADSREAKEGLEAQRAALNKFRNLGQTGRDLESDILTENAAKQAAIQGQGMIGSIRENMAQRGISGGGSELAQSLIAAQGAQNRASMTSQQAAMEAYRNRLQAMRDAANLGGNMRSEAIGIESQNKNAINSFNQRYAARKQDWSQNQADRSNDGQRFNLTNEQDIANKNVGTRNQYQVGERDRRDNLQQREYDNEMDKVRAQAGITSGAREDARASGQANADMYSGVNQGVNTALAYVAPSFSSKKKKDYDDEDEGPNPLNRSYI